MSRARPPVPSGPSAVLAVALVLSAGGPWGAAPAAAQDGRDLDPLREEIARIAGSTGGTLGVSVVHLESGRRVSFNGDEAFPMASTYKVPIAVQLLTRVDRGEVSLEDMVTIEPGDLHPGSGTLTRLFDDPGVVLSGRNLMELMLLISDNSATDLTLGLAGGAAAVTGRMEALGVRGIRVDRPTSVLIADYLGVEGVPPDGSVTPAEFSEMADALSEEEREAAAARFATDPRDTATPDAMARLLEGIWRDEVLSPESSELLRDVLRRVSTGENRLRGLLPPGVPVSHKTGTIGATTNDVGVIDLPGGAGHAVVAAFVKDAPEEVPERERVIAHVARAVYDYFVFVPAGR